jgi:hypothetical protein
MSEAIIMQRLEQQVDRVRDHSAQPVNRRIVREMNANLEQCVRQGREAIMKRLAELDHEWDIDRVLMANFAIAGGVAYGVGLARYSRPRLFGLGRRRTGWLGLVGAQLAFLLLHATVGWCPPMAVWRRLGARTKTEIELERSLLRNALQSSASEGESATASAKPPHAAS